MVSGFVSDKNKTKAVQYKLSGHNSSALSSETVPAGQTECRENYGQMPHAMLKNTAQAEKYRAKPLTSQQTQTTMNTEANRKTEWVVGIGEALWDILPEGRKIGGAPANFAYHMSQFGLRSYAVSAVGDDEAGRELRNQLREKRVGHMLETVPFPTGTVEVTLDGAGIPSYEIRQGVAWANIPFTPQIEELARHTRAACFGSLAQRSPVSHRTIGRFLETMPDGEGQYKVFDINLRQHFYTQQVVEESLRKCNILCRTLLDRYGLRIVILTCGAAGSSVFAPDTRSYLPTPRVEVADTVGAGDSFTASFLAALLSGLGIGEAHRLAVDVAAHVCSQHGAMPRLPERFTARLRNDGPAIR